MGTVIRFPRHSAASLTSAGAGRGTSDGHGASGQCAENQRIPCSRRLTPMPAPHSSAVSFLPSLKARVLTVANASCFSCEYLRATVRSWSMPVMEDISAILPQVSTVILPKAKNGFFGYPADMDRGQLLEWIDRRLKATGHNDSSASKLAGHTDMIRNIRRDRAMPKIESIRDLAKVLGDPPVELLAAPMPNGQAWTLEELRAHLAAAEKQVHDIKSAISTLERLGKKAG